MSRLAGKVAVVTGASKGIGAGIAKAFGAEGAAVVVNYISDKAGAAKVVADIERAGGKAVAVQGDVAKRGDIRRIFDVAREAFGAPTILVNNAGVYEFSALEDITEAHFHKQFDTNVLGLILATQEATKTFPASGGSVINIGSAISASPMPQSAVYSATKGAVDLVTRTLSRELGSRNIRVNSINPGVVETEGVRTQGFLESDLIKQAVAATPLGRVAQPADIASIAVFLASPDSGWLTGETILASGGYR
jgi:3-oxoacyl-[acyl-carrier protein] reductase